MAPKRRKRSLPQPNQSRLRVLLGFIYFGFAAILLRLFYWQVLQSDVLKAAATSQYIDHYQLTAPRGKILTYEGYPLVTNQEVYRLFAEPKQLTDSPEVIARSITPILLAEDQAYQVASTSAEKETIENTLQKNIVEKLSNTTVSWVALRQRLSADTKQKIEAQNIHGLGFDSYLVRYYPEASMAAHITGFVGKNQTGEDTGYFGIEGALDRELTARTVQKRVETDGLGLRLFFNTPDGSFPEQGRDVTLTIRRDIQAMAEAALQKGVEKYGAKDGEVIIMDPNTGAILALASWPSYDQQKFYEYDPALYKNPSLSNTYEPGSTFKTLTVSAGLDAEVIEPDTRCDFCDGPRQIGAYTIRTWNNQYHPEVTMTEALAKSDNVAMIFIAEKLGSERFYEYLDRFGIGQKTYLDLQEDTETPFQKKSGQIHLATNSFGQGIVTNSLQLVRAVAAIANRGTMMRPFIVDQVSNPDTGQVIKTEPIVEKQVISPEAAHKATQMMVAAAEAGEAQWVSSSTYTIAGKTGTSQVAIEGGYAEDRTIASFIGFAPADNPRFIMLVKLVEPQSSPWAAETAAPLWYQIANHLFLLLNIPPDKT